MNLGKNKGWYCIPTSFQTRGAIKELHRAKHNTTEACREGQVEEVYIKRKCGHNNILDPLSCFTISTICLPIFGISLFNPSSKLQKKKILSDPSITHEDDHFARYCIKIRKFTICNSAFVVTFRLSLSAKP
jgi:hypothetical protein